MLLMDLLVALPAFVAAVVVISATPGPAFALIVRRTAVRGRACGLATILGLELGLYAWALLVASGVAVIALSEIGFLVLKIAGCIVLAYLAARSFHSWWKLRKESGRPAEPTTTEGRQPPSRSGAVVEGFAVQMANPKAAIFLLSLYPQFVPRNYPLLQTTALLGLLQVAVETVIYLALALAVHRAGGWFRRSVVRRRLEAVTSTVLVGLGVRLATSHR